LHNSTKGMGLRLPRA